MSENTAKLGDDRYSSTVNPQDDVYLRNGWSWDISTDYLSLASANDYETINFTTPATGTIYYYPIKLDKTGGEIVGTLLECATFTAGTAATLTPRRRNRTFGDTGSPWGTILLGNSASTSSTVTGGVSLIPSLVPGSAQGNSKPPASSAATGVMQLKNSTQYTVKILGKAAATLAAILQLVWIPENK